MNSYAAANLNLTYELKDPARTYVLKMYTTLPIRAGTGGVETTGGGYLQKAITFGTPATGSVFNSNEMTWTATGQWSGGAPQVGVCIFDDLGALKRIVEFAVPRIVDEGATPRLAIGSVECRE